MAPSLEPGAFKLPSYAGGAPSGEGICVLGFLLSADLSGDARVRPLLPSALRWSTPEGIPSNGIGGKATTSYWYELLPAVLLTQLAMRHPESAEMDANLTRMADRYAVIIRELGGPRADFNQTSYITHGPKKGPVVNGRWTEPDASADLRGTIPHEVMVCMERRASRLHIDTVATHVLDQIIRDLDIAS